MSCNDVFCGFWINWSEGKYLGLTLTLQTRPGFALISLLVMMVGFAGTHLWGILCYAVHQLRATPTEQDDLHHQIQVIFRNASSPGEAAIGLCQLIWERRSLRIRLLETLGYLLVSTVYLSALVAAGLFASQTLTVSNEVLVRGPSCGWPSDISFETDLSNATSASEVTVASVMLKMIRSSQAESDTYVRSCYKEDARASLCNTFTQPRIDSQIQLEVPCPFQGDMCSAPAISIDSGIIESDMDLGLSLPASDKVTLRKVTTCAPIHAERYAVTFDGSISDSDTYYDMSGNGTQVGYTLGQGLYRISNPWPEYTIVSPQNSDLYLYTPAYGLSVAAYNLNNDSQSDFTPIPELNSGGDILLLALHNVASYISEVHDPWFEALNVTSNNPPLYTSEGDLSFLGCVEKYQICAGDNCTALTGLYNMDKNDIPALTQNAMQSAVYDLVWKAAWSSQSRITTSILGHNVLLANDYSWGWEGVHISAQVPDDQYQQEVIHLHNISMAVLQRKFAEYAATSDFDVLPGISSISTIIPPATNEAQYLCSRVKARSNSYTSFSVLGICIVIGMSVQIAAVNLTLTSVVDKVKKKWTGEAYKSWEWDETGVLQLHRMACEGRGIGPWLGKRGYIPHTEEPGRKFSLTRLSLLEMIDRGYDEEKT